MEFNMNMFDNVDLSDRKTKDEVVDILDLMTIKVIAEREERKRLSGWTSSINYRRNNKRKSSGNILRLIIAVMNGDVGYEELTECQLNYLKDFVEQDSTVDIKGLQTLNKMLQRKQRHLMQKNQ